MPLANTGSQTGPWKLPRYGNSGKTKSVFPLFPQRLENSPKNVEFSTVPTASTAGSIKTEQAKTIGCVNFKQLTLPLHFQIEFANDK
ncbi:MAG: hypothetical protein LC742_11430, partial [Acidobacteria bacterium]|nr:hypothetical protein [Acidobacteriota bacterium]